VLNGWVELDFSISEVDFDVEDGQLLVLFVVVDVDLVS